MVRVEARERQRDHTKEDLDHGKGMVFILRTDGFVQRHYLQNNWASRILLAQAFGGRGNGPDSSLPPK